MFLYIYKVGWIILMELSALNFYRSSNMPAKSPISSSFPGVSSSPARFDRVSFSGKVQEKEKPKSSIPLRLQSKLQNTFHITGTQVSVRSFLELKEQGLTNEEIAKKWYESSYQDGKAIEVKKEHIETVEKTEQLIKDLDTAFSRVIPSIVPKTYYRGIVEDKASRVGNIINSAKSGDIIQPDLGYPFLASKESYAEGYASYLGGKSDPETCIVMKIKAPVGTPISRDISFAPLEGNVVLARGAKFKVLEKEIKNNKTYITLEYLSCETDKNKAV